MNFQVLGVVLEVATGRRYADYLSEKLWKPIGANDAAVWLDRGGGTARTFGYLFARTEDWARLGLLLLHEGQCDGKTVVPPDFIREMLKPSPTELGAAERGHKGCTRRRKRGEDAEMKFGVRPPAGQVL